MNNENFYNDPISVTALMDDEGRVLPSSFTWRGQQRSVVDIGRQWTSEEGRHVLIATGDGQRFELQLARQNLQWYLKRAWEPEIWT